MAKKKTVEDYQADYKAAKAIGDKAGMDLAHKNADAVRGYETTTTRDSSGGFVQTPVNAMQTQQAPKIELQPVAKTADDYYAARMEEIAETNRQAQQAAEEAQRARTESAITANEAYAPKVQANTEEQLRQAYISNMQARKQAPEALAAMGYTGGLAESSLLGLDTSYQNTRAGLQKSETEALSDIYANSANIRSTGEASLADMANNYYQNLLSTQQNVLSQAQEQANYQQKYDASQLEQDKRDYANTIGAFYQNYAAEKNKVLNDNDPSNDWQAQMLEAARQQKLQEMAAAQYEAEQQSIKNAQAQAKIDYSTGKPYYKISGPTGTSGTSTLTYEQALARYNQGDRSAAVIKVLGID